MDPPLPERLLWHRPERSESPVASEAAVRAQALFYLFVAGTAIASAFIIHPASGQKSVGVAAAIAGALLAAAYVLTRFVRMGIGEVALVAAFGTLLISIGDLFNSTAPLNTSLFYLWVVLFAFYFLPLRLAVAELGLIAACYPGVLVLAGDTSNLGTRMVVLIGSLTVAGALVHVLRNRVNQLVRRLGDVARTDPLTGLANRRAFTEAFELEVERARRGRRPLSLLVGDLDNFKTINDRYGHHVGDVALERVSAVLDGARRRIDTVARVGGEEFALIAPETDQYGALQLAERLRTEVSEALGDEPYDVRLSFGIASYPNHGDTTETLMRAGDAALYAAKALGRDRTVIYSSEVRQQGGLVGLPEDVASGPGETGVATQEAERASIKAVLDRPDALRIVFQPIVSLATGHVAGYEALTRIDSSERRSISGWFAAARRCGLSPEFEALAIRAALAREGRQPGTFLTVNVSASALCSDAVIDVLPEDLSSLMIEVTEHELVSENIALTGRLAELRGRGARIAVDDAGSAYSGLQQVMTVAPDMIKLDRTLVEEIHGRADKAALVESFVRFAHRIGATVCAEGIEGMDDLAVLADLDVHYGQGFGLARPAAEWQQLPEPVSHEMLGWSLRSEATHEDWADVLESSDRRLERLCARIANLTAARGFEEIARPIAEELRAESVTVSRFDPAAGELRAIIAGGLAEPGEPVKLDSLPSARTVLEERSPRQVLAGDPARDPAEIELIAGHGRQAALFVPIIWRGAAIGLLEAYGGQPRPWGRSTINRARIIAYQLGPLLESLAGSGTTAAPAHERGITR